jgi:hypothetical protein
MLRKFGIFIIRSLVVIILASLVFSFVSLDLPKILPGLFEDVFSHASDSSQKEVISKLSGTCGSLEKGEKVISITQICSNATLLSAMKQNCASYRQLKSEGKKIENEQNMEESCSDVESGELEDMCSRQKSSILPDFSRISALCSRYNAGEIPDKKFFSGVLSSPFDIEKIESTQNQMMQKYHEFTGFLAKNKTWSYFVLATLLAILYLLIWNFEEYLIVITGICFSLGIIIILPYVIILLYQKLVGIDTTPILSILFGEGSFDPKSIISVIMLLFLRTYNTFIIITGVILLGIGIGGKGVKIMSHASKKN